MNKTIIKILETNIKGQLKGADIGGGIAIAGSPGIGKTVTMKAIAKNLNLNMVHISIPEVSTENLSGIPDFFDAEHMDAYSITGTSGSMATKWSVPQIIEQANKLSKEEGKDGCILFIDDLHRVNMAVAPYLYGLLGERKLGSFYLDQKVVIMGAMNDSDEAGFSGVDSPIKDRIGILPVSFDFDYWFANWGRGLHFYIASFLTNHSTYIQEDESTMIEQFGSPRSWTHLANEFELHDRQFIQDTTLLLAQQKVSKAAASELQKHIMYMEAIDFTSIIKKKNPLNISDLKPIDQILYAYMINYVVSIDDAKYVMHVIDENINSSNFIGFVVGEIYTKYLALNKEKTVNNGIHALISKFMKSEYTGTKLSEKDQITYDSMDYKQHDPLFELANEFIL